MFGGGIITANGRILWLFPISPALPEQTAMTAKPRNSAWRQARCNGNIPPTAYGLTCMTFRCLREGTEQTVKTALTDKTAPTVQTVLTAGTASTGKTAKTVGKLKYGQPILTFNGDTATANGSPLWLFPISPAPPVQTVMTAKPRNSA